MSEPPPAPTVAGRRVGGAVSARTRTWPTSMRASTRRSPTSGASAPSRSTPGGSASSRIRASTRRSGRSRASGGEVCGVALCTAGQFDMGFVNSLAVRPPWRRRGLGLALLRQAFTWFWERGERRVGLGVDTENPTDARAALRAGRHARRLAGRRPREGAARGVGSGPPPAAGERPACNRCRHGARAPPITAAGRRASPFRRVGPTRRRARTRRGAGPGRAVPWAARRSRARRPGRP